MDFGLAFSFPFQDSEWFKKIALVGIITLIPIVGWLYLMGWMIEVMGRVMRNDPLPLPPDVDFGRFIGSGFKVFIIALVYSIPMIILQLPVGIAPLLPELGVDSETAAIITIVVSLCCGGLGFIYGIVMGLILPAAYGNFVSQNSLGAAFKIGDIVSLVKSAMGAYFIVLLGSLVASLVGQLGVIACVIGMLVTLPYSMAIMGHLYGQAYKVAVSNKSYI